MRYEKGKDGGNLECKVDWCERPVVLGGEDEMDDKDGCEGESDAEEEKLDREGACKVWAVDEDRVVGKAPECNELVHLYAAHSLPRHALAPPQRVIQKDRRTHRL